MKNSLWLFIVALLLGSCTNSKEVDVQKMTTYFSAAKEKVDTFHFRLAKGELSNQNDLSNDFSKKFVTKTVAQINADIEAIQALKPEADQVALQEAILTYLSEITHHYFPEVELYLNASNGSEEKEQALEKLINTKETLVAAEEQVLKEQEKRASAIRAARQ